VVSAYWAAGGTALLWTIGGDLERLGRQGGTAVVITLAITAVAKALGAGLALALVRRPRRVPRVALERAASSAGWCSPATAVC
jgi:Na+/H+-dicarboxylate symporter